MVLNFLFILIVVVFYGVSFQQRRRVQSGFIYIKNAHMKINVLFFILGFLFYSAETFARYDQSWYVVESWAGEYPNGFAIIKPRTKVPGRTVMDPQEPTLIQCELPYRANIHPWNDSRPAKFYTATKIIPLLMKEDVEIYDANRDPIFVKTGETLEYIFSGAEGIIMVRYKGKRYIGHHTLFDKSIYDKSLKIDSDEWVKLTCQGGQTAWILLSDLMLKNQQDEFIDGVGRWGIGYVEYGKVVDIKEGDLEPKI